MSVATDKPVLEYGQRRRGEWLRRHKKLVATFVLMVVLVSGSWHYRAGISRYVRWRYWHWQLARLQPTAVPSSPSTAPTEAFPFWGSIPSRRTEPVIDSLRALDQRIDTMLAPAFRSSAPRQYDFISQRRRPDGQWRTVVIADLSPELTQPFYETRIAVIAPPAFFDVPPPLGRFYVGFGSMRAGRVWRADVLIAEDPADPNALTMEFWSDNRRIGQQEGRVLVARYRLRLTNEDQLAWTTEIKRDDLPSPRIPEKPWGMNLDLMEQREQSKLLP